MAAEFEIIARNIERHSSCASATSLRESRQIEALLSRWSRSSPAMRKAAAPGPASTHYGLIQEHLRDNLFHLVVQAILWNQTTGVRAKPVLAILVTKFPTPELLAKAPVSDLREILRPIGMQNIRAQRLHDMATVWVRDPPHASRRYRKIDYPLKGCGRNVGKSETLTRADPREGWEIAHLPGVGRYALDSFRLFHRDSMLSHADDSEESCFWEDVNPQDKELRLYVAWKRQRKELEISGANL